MLCYTFRLSSNQFIQGHVIPCQPSKSLEGNSNHAISHLIMTMSHLISLDRFFQSFTRRCYRLAKCFHTEQQLASKKNLGPIHTSRQNLQLSVTKFVDKFCRDKFCLVCCIRIGCGENRLILSILYHVFHNNFSIFFWAISSTSSEENVTVTGILFRSRKFSGLHIDGRTGRQKVGRSTSVTELGCS